MPSRDTLFLQANYKREDFDVGATRCDWTELSD